MELRKESVQMLHVKSRATSQVTFDADYNVPDAKPDMGRLIQSKGDIVMDEVRLSEGKAFISGNLNADVLYVGEEDQKVCSLAAKLPFDETLNLEGIAGGDKMCLKWEIEDLSVHMIHSRKLNIKAIVTFYAGKILALLWKRMGSFLSPARRFIQACTLPESLGQLNLGFPPTGIPAALPQLPSWPCFW